MQYIIYTSNALTTLKKIGTVSAPSGDLAFQAAQQRFPDVSPLHVVLSMQDSCERDLQARQFFSHATTAIANLINRS